MIMEILAILIVGVIILFIVIKLQLQRDCKMKKEHERFMIVAGQYNWLYMMGMRETAEHFNELNYRLARYKTTLGM